MTVVEGHGESRRMSQSDVQSEHFSPYPTGLAPRMTGTQGPLQPRPVTAAKESPLQALLSAYPCLRNPYDVSNPQYAHGSDMRYEANAKAIFYDIIQQRGAFDALALDMADQSH